MPNGFRKEQVAKPYYSAYGDFETSSKFNKPSRDRKYIKILSLCLTYVPSTLIFRGIKNPIQKQLRDMCRAGLLERYSRAGSRAYWYKTTPMGQDLLIKALEVK